MRLLPLCGSLAVAAFMIGASARQASAQQPGASYYGLPSKQAPSPGGPANYACIPNPPDSTPGNYGCRVTVEACPCQNRPACLPDIPPIHTPSCQNPCVVYNEGPPTTTPRTIDIYRNCYVPIRIDYRPGPNNITPVNINVKWREVHFLCGPDGQPLPSEQAAAILKELQSQVAAGGNAAPPEGAVLAPPAPVFPSPSASATPATVPEPTPAPAANQAQNPNRAYKWIYVTTAQKYGYGYIDENGYAVVDPSSYRLTVPEQPSPTAASNDVASTELTAATTGNK